MSSSWKQKPWVNNSNRNPWVVEGVGGNRGALQSPEKGLWEGDRVREQGSTWTPGLQTPAPDSQPLSPPELCSTLCSGWGPLQLLTQTQTLETVFWLLLCPTVLATWQPGLCPQVPITTSELPSTRPLLPWTPFDSGPHSLSWNKAQDPSAIPEMPLPSAPPH